MGKVDPLGAGLRARGDRRVRRRARPAHSHRCGVAAQQSLRIGGGGRPRYDARRCRDRRAAVRPLHRRARSSRGRSPLSDREAARSDHRGVPRDRLLRPRRGEGRHGEPELPVPCRLTDRPTPTLGGGGRSHRRRRHLLHAVVRSDGLSAADGWPLLFDMAVHHFDQLRTVVGLEPIRVWARTSNPSWSPFRGNSEGFVRLETDENVSISYVGSWASCGRQTGWGGCWRSRGILARCNGRTIGSSSIRMSQNRRSRGWQERCKPSARSGLDSIRGRRSTARASSMSFDRRSATGGRPRRVRVTTFGRSPLSRPPRSRLAPGIVAVPAR